VKKEGPKFPKDRRREVRVSAENKVILEPLGESAGRAESQPYCLLTEDISPGGCRILSSRSFPAATLLSVELPLSKVKKMIKTKGEVRWVRSVEDGELFEMGIEFIDLPPESLVALLEYSYKKTHPKKVRA
jgi:c-di-GMP-binding flagellar brake protein YcgR